MTKKNRLISGLVALAVVAGVSVATPQVALAQCPSPESCVNTIGADGKGIVGLGILGAEIGFMIPALIVGAGARELDEAWAWILFPVIGAAGGAVAGYFALEDPTQTDAMGMITRGFPEAAVIILAVSMALIVPTFVGVLSLTSYSPSGDGQATGASGDEDAEANEAPPAPAESEEQSALRRTLAGGPGLIRFDGTRRGQLLLGIPMVHTADRYTEEEREHLQLPQDADFRIPVVSGTF